MNTLEIFILPRSAARPRFLSRCDFGRKEPLDSAGAGAHHREHWELGCWVRLYLPLFHLRFVIGVDDIGVAAGSARKGGKSACRMAIDEKTTVWESSLQCGKIVLLN